MPCIHGARARDGSCVCNTGWSLTDCSVFVEPLPPVYKVWPPRAVPSDNSLLFPQDDVVDVAFDSGGGMSWTSRATGTLRVARVKRRVRGTEGGNESYHVSFPHERFLGVRAFGLKSSLDVDPSLVRERLANRFFLAAGALVPRETFARVTINETDLGLFTLQEQIDGDFFAARKLPFDDATTALWKMGDRRNDNMDSPKTSFANSTAGRAAFLTAKRACENGTAAAVEAAAEVAPMLQSLAASAVTSNRDNVVLGHNYYLYWPDVSSPALSVTYDMDRSLGQGSLPDYYVDWPLFFCSPFVPWCGRFMSLFPEAYRSTVVALVEQYVRGGHFAADLSILDSVASQFRPRGNHSAEIAAWMDARVAFLLSASGSTKRGTAGTADSRAQR
jgi:hypothetical protein